MLNRQSNLSAQLRNYSQEAKMEPSSSNQSTHLQAVSTWIVDSWTPLTAGLAAALVVCLYLHQKVTYSYWSKKNVGGPRPLPILGNLYDIIMNRARLNMEWTKRFGGLYGIYQGSKPILIINDPELIQQICVKDFDNFQNHAAPKLANKFVDAFLFMMQGERWKKVRTFMSPTFTSGKIKRMFRLLDDCVEDLVAAYREQLTDANPSKLVNVKDTYNLYTMDAITTCCYGLKLMRANSVNLKSAATRDEFVGIAMKIFKPRIKRRIVAEMFPHSLLKLVGFRQNVLDDYDPLAAKVSRLMEARKKTEKKFDDYLQLLIDAKLDDKLELTESDAAENHHAGLTEQSLLEDQRRMTEDVKASYSPAVTKANLEDIEVLSNAMFLLAVGLETTSVLLTNVTYALAHHQDVQARLYEELIKIVEYNEDKTRLSFSYEALTSCRYLDAVLSEALRSATPVWWTDRVAINDYYIEKYKVHIPAGMALHINWNSVMNDPQYWEEPTRFDPSRFLPENKDKIVPGSYAPFGYGPRHCIGMRFSLTEAKLALAKMMMNFKFEPAPGSVYPPPLERVIVVMNIKQPEVKLVPRNQQL